jgi:hypothetical protein
MDSETLLTATMQGGTAAVLHALIEALTKPYANTPRDEQARLALKNVLLEKNAAGFTALQLAKMQDPKEEGEKWRVMWNAVGNVAPAGEIIEVLESLTDEGLAGK